MKKSFVIAILSVFVLGLIMVSGAATPSLAKDTLTLKVAGISAPEYRGTKSLYTIKDVVEKGTEGRVILDVFPANQLGDYTLVYEELIRSRFAPLPCFNRRRNAEAAFAGFLRLHHH